jgi:hypothetical protein
MYSQQAGQCEEVVADGSYIPANIQGTAGLM